MYKMRSEAKRLTKERKVTAGTYFKIETHTLRVYRKLTDKDYVMWVKTIDLQKHLCHRNLCHVAIKKVKTFCGAKHLTKEQVKKFRKKNESMEVYTFVKILLLK